MKKKMGISEYIRKNKATFLVYVTLRIMVVLAMIFSLLRGRYEHVFVCAVTLILFLTPMFIEKNMGIKLPTALEVIMLLFIYAAEILGEMHSFYIKYAWWDTMLHTLNGFLCAGAGFALVDILNRNSKIKFSLSPVFMAVVAFCFSMTIGVLWEFFEYGCDMLLKTDMQKDTVISLISSTYLDPTMSNKAILIENIKEISINGTEVSGYLDIGLIDTMKDLIVNFIGAAVFSVIGYFYVKSRGKGKFAKHFIPEIKDEK